LNRSSVAKFLVRVNAFAPLRYLNRSKLLILMYHRFSEAEEAGKTSRAVFERHLAYITRHYRVVPITEAVNRIVNGYPVPERSAVITVDDGYKDFYQIAYPTLRRFNVPAAIYIVSGFVNGDCWLWTDKARFILAHTTAERIDLDLDGRRIQYDLAVHADRHIASAEINSVLKKVADDEKERMIHELASGLRVDLPDDPPDVFKPMNWDEVREIASNAVEIGSHTATHPILTNVDSDRLADELRSSKAKLENELQRGVTHFCYPNGNFSTRELEGTRDAGYRSAVTTELRLCGEESEPFTLPRIDAEPEMHRFIQATSGFDSWK
jgi:peptidoglycan/xylan/chitin deacetylase (PgdA/CDA1 family)